MGSNQESKNHDFNKRERTRNLQFEKTTGRTHCFRENRLNTIKRTEQQYSPIRALKRQKPRIKNEDLEIRLTDQKIPRIKSHGNPL